MSISLGVTLVEYLDDQQIGELTALLGSTNLDEVMPHSTYQYLVGHTESNDIDVPVAAANVNKNEVKKAWKGSKGLEYRSAWVDSEIGGITFHDDHEQLKICQGVK